MFYRKEKEVNMLIVKHLDMVDHCLTTALNTVEEYLNDNIDEAKVLAINVDKYETDTDCVRREIISKLYSEKIDRPMVREIII